MRSKWKVAALATTLTLATLGLVPSAMGVAPATPDAGAQDKKPVSSVSTEVKQQPDAKFEQSKGKTNLLPTDANGMPQVGVSKLAGNIAALDFLTPYMGCYGNAVQTGIKNNTASTQWYRIDFYNGSESRTVFGSVAANSYAYPTFYGVNGNGASAGWSAYMYVYSGGSYQYDEYRTGSFTCSVSITFSNWGYGYIQLAIKNNGTAQASVNSRMLAPTGTSGTYTGSKWDYPAPGGATLYRYFYAGTGVKYGVYSDVLGSQQSTWSWFGTLS